MTKRIIDGKTYNTETARCTAKEVFPPNGSNFEELYQTRRGAYFRHYGNWGATNFAGEILVMIEPWTPQEAQKWMEDHEFTAPLETHFGEQPEAGESESRVTFHIPDSLKNWFESLASKNGQSHNAWLMRCGENCATQQENAALAAKYLSAP